MGFKDGLWAEVYNRISGDSITTKLGDTSQIWVVWYGVVFVSICVVSDVWVLAKKKRREVSNDTTTTTFIPFHLPRKYPLELANDQSNIRSFRYKKRDETREHVEGRWSRSLSWVCWFGRDELRCRKYKTNLWLG